MLVVRDEAGDQLGAVRLLDEVELGGQMRLELVGQRRQLQQPRGLRAPLGERRQRAEQLEVEGYFLLDPRPPHLDDDLAARPQQAAVNLGDRGTGERLLVEPREDLEPDLLVDDPARLVERERRHVVDQPLEFLDVDVRKQIRPRGQHLAELDEGRPELFQPFAERLGSLTGRRAVADGADLPEHAQQPAAARDTANLERAPGPASSHRHRVLLPGRKTPETRARRGGRRPRRARARIPSPRSGR